MEREACVCDHGFERSDLCAEIIIIIIIIVLSITISASDASIKILLDKNRTHDFFCTTN